MKTKPVSRGSWKVILRKDIPFFYSDYIKSILNLTPVEGGGATLKFTSKKEVPNLMSTYH